jgi:hypothetical protein
MEAAEQADPGQRGDHVEAAIREGLSAAYYNEIDRFCLPPI